MRGCLWRPSSCVRSGRCVLMFSVNLAYPLRFALKVREHRKKKYYGKQALDHYSPSVAAVDGSQGPHPSKDTNSPAHAREKRQCSTTLRRGIGRRMSRRKRQQAVTAEGRCSRAPSRSRASGASRAWACAGGVCGCEATSSCRLRAPTWSRSPTWSTSAAGALTAYPA